MFEAAARSSSDADNDHCGWLDKQGHVNLDFKRRYFVLLGGRLSYFESVEAASKGKAKGNVNVTGVFHFRPAGPRESQRGGPPSEKVARAFRFDTAERKPFVVIADTIAQKFGWMRALSAISQRPARIAPTTVQEAYRHELTATLQARAAAGTSHTHEVWSAVAEGVTLAKKGDADAAEAALERARAMDERGGGPTLYACFELSKLSAGRRHFEKAVTQVEAALLVAAREHEPQLRLQLAWCLWQAGRAAPAEEVYWQLRHLPNMGRSVLLSAFLVWQVYWQLLDEEPLAAETHLDRARMQLQERCWELGAGGLQLAAALGKGGADVLNDLGVCHYELARHAEAERFFAEALAQRPAYPQALINRGNCRRKEGRLEEAMEDYSAALELNDRNAKAYNNRGALLLTMHRFAAAVDDFDRALELEPESPSAMANRQLATERMAQMDESSEVRARQLTAHQMSKLSLASGAAPPARPRRRDPARAHPTSSRPSIGLQSRQPALQTRDASSPGMTAPQPCLGALQHDPASHARTLSPALSVHAPFAGLSQLSRGRSGTLCPS